MIHEGDKEFLNQLVKKRQTVEVVPLPERSFEGLEWGLHFEDIFKDIEPSISIQLNGNSVNIKIDAQRIPFNGNEKEDVYIGYNHTLDLEVRVLQRIALLRYLEENRYLIWINNGHRSVISQLKYSEFFLIDDDDKEYVRKRYDLMAVATNELVELVKHRYKDVDERRFICNYTTTWIAIAVTFLIGIAPHAKSLIKLIIDLIIK